MGAPFPLDSLCSCAVEAPVVTLLTLLPPCRARCQVWRCSWGPHTILSFSAPPELQPFFPNSFHKWSLKIGVPGKASLPSLSKMVPPSTSQWPPPQCQCPAPLRKRAAPTAALPARACGHSSTCRSQNSNFPGKAGCGAEHQHVQVLEPMLNYCPGITAPRQQTSGWIYYT